VDRDGVDGGRYEALARYQLRYSVPGIRRKPGDLGLHRRLRVPASWRDDNRQAAASDYTYDLCLGAMQLPSDPLVVDAGCGFGAGVFRLQALLGGVTVGVSTSYTQIETAKSERVARGHIEDSVRFELTTYDHLPCVNADLIIAVESLVHSPSLLTTIAHWHNSLSPGGVVCILDDMSLSEIVGAEGDGEASTEEIWEVDHFWSVEEYRAACVEAGLSILEEDDLTFRVYLLPEWLLSVSGALLKALRALLPNRSRCAQIVGFHLAQLQLHRRYRRNSLRYIRIIAVKRVVAT
jgi:SAM-dependent methyltransferase